MIVHVCSCGRRYDEAAWSALPGLARWHDDEERYESRTCACNSTRTRAWCQRCDAEIRSATERHVCEARDPSSTPTVQMPAVREGKPRGRVAAIDLRLLCALARGPESVERVVRRG